MITERLRDIFDGTPWLVNDPDYVVKMRCPEDGHVVATESTVPEWTEDRLAAYSCERCRRFHVFRWGPPSPEYVRDESLYRV
jgi:hypothetical protein